MKLLEKALSHGRNRHRAHYSPEELELVEAWLNDEVGVSQVAKAKNQKGTGNVYTFLAIGCKILLNEANRKRK